MMYRVYLDGTSIYENAEGKILLEPSLTMELNSAGSFSFKMPPNHESYSLPVLLKSIVDVYEIISMDDNTEIPHHIWNGRVIKIDTDFYNNKKIECEGCLAYFNDSIQRPAEYEEISVRDFFRTLIDNHNAQCPAEHRFTVGNIFDISDALVYRKLNYEKTKSALETMCLNTNGGYFLTRQEDSVNYIDWYGKLDSEVSTQSVQFGINLTDLSQYIDASEIVTSLIPLGKQNSQTGEYLTIASINEGLDYIDNPEQILIYGRIFEVKNFNIGPDNYDEVTSDELYIYKRLLKNEAEEYLAKKKYEPLTIEVSAAELHYIEKQYLPFRIGTMVHVNSPPHNLNKNLPLIKLDIKLDSATKSITIGTEKRRELTEIKKEKQYG